MVIVAEVVFAILAVELGGIPRGKPCVPLAGEVVDVLTVAERVFT